MFTRTSRLGFKPSEFPFWKSLSLKPDNILPPAMYTLRVVVVICLGLSLFTSVKLVIIIIITTIAVIFTYYAAVFPLSQVINFLHKHAREQCTGEPLALTK
jgi:hypothetical protein